MTPPRLGFAGLNRRPLIGLTVPVLQAVKGPRRPCPWPAAGGQPGGPAACRCLPPPLTAGLTPSGWSPPPRPALPMPWPPRPRMSVCGIPAAEPPAAALTMPTHADPLAQLLAAVLAYRPQPRAWPHPRPPYLPHPRRRLPRLRGVVRVHREWRL